MDCTVHGVTGSLTRLSHFNFHCMWKQDVSEDASNTLFRQILDQYFVQTNIWCSGALLFCTVFRQAAQASPRGLSEMQGIHSRPMNESLCLTHPPVTDIHIKIRKLCSNGFHLGEEFKIDHLEIILDYTSLVRSKLITLHVLGHPG